MSSQIPVDISSGILDDIQVNVTALTMVAPDNARLLQASGLVTGIESAALYDALSLLVEVNSRAAETGAGVGAVLDQVTVF